MDTSRLPLDIKELLRDHIESVSQLEALFLFFKNQDRSWSAQSLSRELRNSETWAAKQIKCFLESGFIQATSEKDFIYAPANDKFRDVIAHLNAVYGEYQVAVITFIYEKPKDQLKGFADAFKIKKD